MTDELNLKKLSTTCKIHFVERRQMQIPKYFGLRRSSKPIQKIMPRFNNIMGCQDRSRTDYVVSSVCILAE